MTTQLAREQLAQAYPCGTNVSGTVTITPQFGVFVQLDGFPDDVLALLEIVHIPNLNYQHYPNDFPIGARIEATVLGWTENSGQVRLTQLNHQNQLLVE
ncbi:hypothetical protein [Hymenobacter persicinus]|uniref:S1 motif domain-containing protein n=1 Tax=Hymenobacter persicinus TaxID=2025506 RepID=A0A4Q5L7A8_9BACT|nr:hypothetical protein [Hymenobacter persicinus]RYU76696.1 hypothetical protein EWM57_18315 [Hymenobacter persicinus]